MAGNQGEPESISKVGREAWRSPGIRTQAAITVAVLVLGLVAQGQFVLYNEGQSGVVLPDPVLALFAPMELSNLTFTLIYGALALGLATLAREPNRLVHALQAYALLAVFRVGMMAVVPLDPPSSIIPLRDPLVQLIGSGAPLTRDLFFSGHTGTLFLLFLALPMGRIRSIMFFLAAIVGTLTVLQHTHYVIDVLVAPFVAYGSLRLVGRWRRSNSH
jgi:hypothetical protein